MATFLAHVAFETNGFSSDNSTTQEYLDGMDANVFLLTQSADCASDITSSTCLQGPLMMDQDTFNNFFVTKLGETNTTWENLV